MTNPDDIVDEPDGIEVEDDTEQADDDTITEDYAADDTGEEQEATDEH